jgi:hypothetical protein
MWVGIEQALARGAGVTVAFDVEDEIGAGERTIGSI